MSTNRDFQDRVGVDPARGIALRPVAARRDCCWPIAWATRPWRPRPSRSRLRPRSKAKSVIQIFLWGGMSHNDTWDPKPESGRDYMGEFAKAIPTNVAGIQIGELFPLLAKQADKFSLIRSMTHRNNGHETAAYLMQTGHTPGERLAYPSIGAVFCAVQGPGVQGRDSALRGADAAPGTVLRRGLPGAEVQALRHRRRPQRASGSRSKASSPAASPTSGRRPAAQLLGKLNTMGALMAGNPAGGGRRRVPRKRPTN